MANGPLHSRELRQRWGVILAGGDGVRLRPLTRFICGDERPKQFCPLYGGATLLEHARRRATRSICDERLLFSLNRAHEEFYMRGLADNGVWTGVLEDSVNPKNMRGRDRPANVAEVVAMPLPRSSEIRALAETERELIIRALATAGGNKSEAARILGIGRDALRYKLMKHGLETITQLRRRIEPQRITKT